MMSASRQSGGRGPRRGARKARLGRDGFFTRVYALVARIARGRVVTYSQIARMLGAPRSGRIVGWAMHGSRIPSHRVIQQGWTCSPNFSAGDPGAQRRLLEADGVKFLLDGRVNLESHLWHPGPDTLRSRRKSMAPPGDLS